MLSMADKYDSVNEHIQEVSESMKLHILGVSMKFTRQLANAVDALNYLSLKWPIACWVGY